METRWLCALAGFLACLILEAAPVKAESAVVATVTVPLITREVVASNINTSSAIISWKTNGDASSQVFYDTQSHGNIADYACHTGEAPTLVSEHSLSLTGLSSSTPYHYRVRSAIPGTQFIAISEDYTFTTLSPPLGWIPPPPSPPVVTTISLTGLEAPTPLQVDAQGIVQASTQLTTADGKVSLNIAQGTKLLDAQGNRLASLSAAPEPSPPAPPAGAAVILAYNLGPDGATFDSPLTLTISYDPSLIPAGVNEEDLVIAYYHGDAGKWIELDSIIDTEANIISAKVSHFTAFAVFGFPPVVPPVVPPVIPVVPPVPPAAFTVSHLSVSPSEVYIGETVTISVIVTNIGGEAGSYEVTLKINSVVEATKEVTVNAGLAKEVTFTTTRDIAGTYLVDVDGLSGSFIVKEKPAIAEIPPVIPKPVNWPLIGGIIAAVVVVALLVFFLLRRRGRAA